MAIKENAEEFETYLKKDESLLHNEQKQIEVVREIVKKTGKDPEGRISHYFPGTFDEVDEYLQLQNSMNYVLETYRNYMFLDDRKWLDAHWPKMKKAMDSVIAMHVIDDSIGLPYLYRDEETNERISVQTYDGWDFEGYSLYVNTLWISSLIVSQRIAELYTDQEYAEKMQNLLQKAQNSTEKLLWNGEYYNLWCNPHTEDGTLKQDYFIHSDGLNGQWYGHYLSLGDILDKDRIKSTLQAIAKYCHIPNEGMLNGFYPDKHLDKTDKPDWNYQSASPWTGTEYCVASLFLQEGMTNEALQIVKDVYERYLRFGALWKHIECGSHYSRALDIWCVLMDLEGYLYHATSKSLKFSPKINYNNFNSVFVNGAAWGLLSNKVKGNVQISEIKVQEGALYLKKIDLGLPINKNKVKSVTIQARSEKIIFESKVRNSEILIQFENDCVIKENEKMTIRIEF